MKNEITGMRLRLIVMNFLQFAVWGAYLTSMGTYLFNIGLGAKIGLFYAMQGIVSLFMPAIMGIIADRWVPAQNYMVSVILWLPCLWWLPGGMAMWMVKRLISVLCLHFILLV